MTFVISFFAAVIIFGLLALSLWLKSRRDARRIFPQVCGQGHVCQCKQVDGRIRGMVPNGRKES
jgi:hypothetical protein